MGWDLEVTEVTAPHKVIEADDWLVFFDMRQNFETPTSDLEIWIDNVDIEGVHSGEVSSP